MDWDSDIDLGIWSTDIAKINEVLKKFKNFGFYTKVGFYRDKPYIYTIKDVDRRRFKPIHIHVFFRHQDYAYSPQTVSYEDRDFDPGKNGFYESPKTRKILVYIRKLARSRHKGHIFSMLFKQYLFYPLWVAFLISKNMMDRSQWSLKYPFSTLYASYTWTLPARYFNKLETIEIYGFEIPIPSNVDEYLTYRYGNYMVPIQDWDYWLNDGAIECIRPEIKCPSIFK